MPLMRAIRLLNSMEAGAITAAQLDRLRLGGQVRLEPGNDFPWQRLFNQFFNVFQHLMLIDTHQ